MRPQYLAALALILIGGSVWLALSFLEKPDSKDKGLLFQKTSFTDIAIWTEIDTAGTVTAFQKSCTAILRMPPARPMPGAKIAGTAGGWHAACSALEGIRGDTQSAKAYFEKYFQPYAVIAANGDTGKFTGYYEPVLRGSFEKKDTYQIPLLARPDDLVMVDLGAFRSDLKGRRIAGSVVGGRLQPYASRTEIEKGTLDSRAMPIVYVDSAIDAFFLHIQGSGRVRMEDGSLLRVGYHAQNGHPYTSIGRYMRDMGYLSPDNISMQSIRAWLQDNPDKVSEVLHKNRSYVFFRKQEGSDGPFGSAGVALTPGYSLAVDRVHLAMHLPIILSSSHPDPADRAGMPHALNRLMIAQDTGGAIRGEIRGDVFWGHGNRAEEIAGRMANQGKYWILLPKTIAVGGLQPR